VIEDSIGIDPLSLIPLHIECFFQKTGLSQATGFCVERDGAVYLVTNWHVVSGQNSETGQPLSKDGATPDRLRVWHHSARLLGEWVPITYGLFGSDGMAWIEHPSGRDVDVVVIPLPKQSTIKVYPLDLSLAQTDLVISPSEPVSIIGFPLGLAVDGKVPIWKTGHVASDIDVTVRGKPAFLIDATTTGGMSGSPVIARRIGAYKSSTASIAIGAGVTNRFMGIYSGRLRAEMDVGIVWRPTVLDEIFASIK